MMWKALARGRIPLVFDMLFGNFRNPRHFEMETSIYTDASQRITDIFLFKDVNSN